MAMFAIMVAHRQSVSFYTNANFLDKALTIYVASLLPLHNVSPRPWPRAPK